MVGGMPGRCHHPQRGGIGLNLVTITQQTVWLKAVILASPIGRQRSQYFGAGRRRQWHGARRVITVRMGDQNLLNRPRRGAADAGLMLGNVGPRIDDGDAASAQQVGIGTRPRHHAWIRRHHSADAWRELFEQRRHINHGRGSPVAAPPPALRAGASALRPRPAPPPEEWSTRRRASSPGPTPLRRPPG